MSEKLTPPGMQAPVTSKEGSNDVSDTSKSNQHPAIWALLGFAVAMALVVLVLLPSLVDQDDGEAEIQPVGLATSPQVAPLPVGVIRSDAEQSLKTFLRKRAEPELAKAEYWATDDWNKALNTALEGDRDYGEGDFNSALSAYKNAIQQLQALQDSKPQKIIESLSAGWQALDLNQSVEASKSFERVLAMQDGQVEASAGLAQARARDQVLQLMNDGQLAEQGNNLQQAADAYKQAVQIDPAYKLAVESENKVKKRLIEASFERAMSTALQSLERGRYKEADTALNQAATIHPDSLAVKDTRTRLFKARRQSTLSNLIMQSEQKAVKEDWAAVITLSQKALAIDSRSLAATNSLKYAVARKKLNQQFDHYLTDTSRLSSDAPLANAEKLVQANQNIPSNEPRLRGKRERLQEALRLAVIPVDMLIRSDGKTSISIFHVGRLGMFQQKKLTLRPGRYTVTGSCSGYRDVRKIVTLKPDKQQYSVDIRCEELI